VFKDYQQLEVKQAKPRRVVDHSARWAKLTPVDSVTGGAADQVQAFCSRKQITLAALVALGARVSIRAGGGIHLAFCGTNGNGVITAIKYRPVGGSSHDSTAERPSTWLRPNVVGNLGSLDWFIAEGETDTARLYDLVGDDAAILCLPAGARTFNRQWADTIPRGATVHLAHDADEDGDQGAAKAAAVLGGRTVRIRAPGDAVDWCEWPGSRTDFIELVRKARIADERKYEFVTYREFAARRYPVAEPLLGTDKAIYLAVGSLLMNYGADGAGKSTWTIDGIVHLAAGVDWLGIPVPRPVRICIIENEGPPSLFQQKLDAKITNWEGPDPSPNLFVFAGPWGEFTFADPEARAALNEFCDEHQIDAVTANPTLGLGVAASGKPDETQQFVDWLVECGLKGKRAFWLLHHENKAGQISGDWGRHPDTKVSLQRDGNQQRTRLDWAKTRWATLDSGEKVVMLEWELDTQGYTVIEMDTVGATESELQARIDAYLAEHPLSSTTKVETEVKGTAGRIRKLLEGSRYDCVDGPRGAKLWLLAATPSASNNDGVTE
jgi:hypothetical protein